MFVEGDIEVTVKDRAAPMDDDHEMKLWVQRSFKNLSCYRISNFKKESAKEIRATVAIKTTDLPENEREMIESRPNDAGLLRSFIEKMFEGKGTIRAVGHPTLKQS